MVSRPVTAPSRAALYLRQPRKQEARMYIGGGLITLIVVILLLAWLL
jgi:type II secretory pathway component PulM